MTIESNVLQFSKFKIKGENGKTQIKVSNSGAIKMGKQLIGRINKNGSLTSKEGVVIAQISDDGILKDATGKPLIKIDNTGKIDNGSGKFIKWTDEGQFMKGDENTKITIVPANKDSYQTASIILFLYLSFK